jgi:zinc protease
MSVRTILITLLMAIILCTGTSVAQKAGTGDMNIVDLPYKVYTLPNGLTVVMHEDHKAPIVAVNVWYHVGSKNEKPGKSGFAHLFEHLMFNGSENFNDDYFQAMERIGATDMNGTTNTDRTNYFQNVPTSAFDLALWMESDRMGHLLGAITQAKLDEQRGVVQNEKRQGENQPYAIADDLITKATWPANHPYAHTVIGSMEDLNAASLEDVKEWFRTYYGPANAVLSVAGDIDMQDALARVKKYFGDIPSGPPIAKAPLWTAKMTGTIRQTAQDRVPQARIFKVWNVPGWGTREASQLSMLASILSNGKTSRLYKRLVYDDQIATNVNAMMDLSELAGQFMIDATAKPGADLAKVEKAIDEELAKVLSGGVTDVEMERIKTMYEAGFTRGIERIGGFGGKSDILAQNMVYGGSPDYYKTTMGFWKSATGNDIVKTASAWLSDGVYVLEIHPFPAYTAAPPDTTLRKALPTPGAPPAAKFPDFQRATLKNGMKVMLAQRSSVPMVNMSAMFNAGYASDQSTKAGMATLAMNMMDEGTATRSALQISEELLGLGANLSTSADLDYDAVTLSCMTSKLDAALNIFADVILNPSFPQADLDRLRQQTLAGIQREKTTPNMMGMRVLPALLFGKAHAYGMPFTGSGFESSVKAITRDDVVKYHQTWIRPNNATLIVSGDISMDKLLPKLEKLFQAWKPADVPGKNIARVAPPASSVIYLIDKPGAQQSTIFAAQLAQPANNPNETAAQAMNTLLGGAFTSRINMNLREGKHWTYGARTSFIPTCAQRPLVVTAPVQTDKTKESMVEIQKELNEIIGTRPPSPEEVEKTRKNMSLRLPGQWETNNAIAGSLGNLVRYNWPDDYYQKSQTRLAALSDADIATAAKENLTPGKLIWVIVGDRSKIEAGIRSLNYGDVKLVDADGNQK